MPPSVTRRTFLKAGLLGTLVLASAGGAYRVFRSDDAPTGFVLDTKAHAALAAIVPVVLKGAMVPAESEVAVTRVQHAVAGLPLATQKEVQDLFALLTLAPTRRLVAGISSDWTEAAPAEIEAFLQSWRLSRFALLQSAYQALHDLITGSWYADESTWPSIGYPGPLKELS